jgi:DNA replicative helicase MCM subunit Mcm2 (Cdc46/Mcm family)
VFRKKSNLTGNNQKGALPSKGTTQGKCRNWKFDRVDGTSRFGDYQEAKIQELFTSMKPGHIPRSLPLILENKLVESCLPGDDVKVSGVLIERWIYPPFKDQRPELQTCIYVNDIQIINKSENKGDDTASSTEAKEFKDFWVGRKPIEGRNIIIDSIAPNLSGRYEEKLGLLLSLIGGVPIPGKDSVRGKIHVLFVGDPGTGKSQLLRYTHNVSSRSVMTNGTGTTG